MNQLDSLRSWLGSLQARERALVISAAVVIIATLFYLLLWEPLHQGLDEQQQRHENQINTFAWMQSASAEIASLKTAGVKINQASLAQPVSLLIEKSSTTSGLRKYLSKLESTADKGARVTFDSVSFDQLAVWLDLLETRHGISISSASIERLDKSGLVSARLTLKRT